ncbi:SIS domain-containing protein [Candidatus Undinarchaeota archaeon]
MKEDISSYFDKTIALSQKTKAECLPLIEEISGEILDSLRNGGKIVLFGNGGSAADSQHIAAEFVNRFKLERKAIPALALSTDTSILTAIANDYSYENVFERQVEALVKKEDIVIAITTSGKSKNVLNALKKAKELGAKTVAFTGSGGTQGHADIELKIPSSETPRIQEMHSICGHIICELVENELFK